MDALALYKQYGAPAMPQNYNIYKRLVVELLGRHDLCSSQAYRTWADLRDLLLSLNNDMSEHADDEDAMVSAILDILMFYIYINIYDISIYSI